MMPEGVTDRPADVWEPLLAVADAAGFGSFENLKQLERDDYFVSSRLKAVRKGDEQSQKVREGGSGGYRARLGEVEAERIDAYISEHLDPVFGYSSQAKAQERRRRSKEIGSRLKAGMTKG